MDKIKDGILIFVAAMAMFAILFAVYQAMNEKVSAAAFLGPFGIALVFLVYLPQIEVFKLFGLETRMSQTITRGEDIIASLQKASLANARVAYLTSSVGSLDREKQYALDQLNSELRAQKVSEAEIREISQPYLRYIALTFSNQYISTVASRLRKLARNDVDLGALIGPLPRPNLSGEHQFALAENLRHGRESSLLKADQEKAASLLKQIDKLAKGCFEAGGLTPEAADFQAQYQLDWQKLTAATFD